MGHLTPRFVAASTGHGRIHMQQVCCDAATQEVPAESAQAGQWCFRSTILQARPAALTLASPSTQML